ncbi:hypothetical protein LSTR_LSTR008965 [Laodelphax striatellus]|uniref:Uncharacterized protein n=1 Tax=Laodelphax striatellus TaxID=195883 RepID=A0A482WKR5_LAOST|nr:hypothetical protein LSTR_LSTR008965 [Laodelphax striatellus]
MRRFPDQVSRDERADKFKVLIIRNIFETGCVTPVTMTHTPFKHTYVLICVKTSITKNADYYLQNSSELYEEQINSRLFESSGLLLRKHTYVSICVKTSITKNADYYLQNSSELYEEQINSRLFESSGILLKRESNEERRGEKGQRGKGEKVEMEKKRQREGVMKKDGKRRGKEGVRERTEGTERERAVKENLHSFKLLRVFDRESQWTSVVVVSRV